MRHHECIMCGCSAWCCFYDCEANYHPLCKTHYEAWHASPEMAEGAKTAKSALNEDDNWRQHAIRISNLFERWVKRLSGVPV